MLPTRRSGTHQEAMLWKNSRGDPVPIGHQIRRHSADLDSCQAVLNAGIARGIAQWPRGREIKFYPLVKKLTLDLAATSFLGEELGDELEATKQALIAMLAASIAVIRAPLPGTRMRRGLQGRAQLVDYFDRQIPLRRERGGEDLFSQLCGATWEDNSLLSAVDIVNHMIFLMLAAHDTLTSFFTSLVYRLAAVVIGFQVASAGGFACIWRHSHCEVSHFAQTRPLACSVQSSERTCRTAQTPNRPFRTAC